MTCPDAAPASFRRKGVTIGPLPVEVRLDEALRGTGAVRLENLPGPPSLAVHLSASVAFGRVRPLADGTLESLTCRLQWDGNTVTGECAPGAGALQRALRFASQPALLERGWILLHAASVRLADGVHVFAARSGTGKSTLARRLCEAGAVLLGDEVSLLGEGLAAAHPGQGACGTRGVLEPVAAVHLLRRGGPKSEPVARASAAAELLSLAMVYETSPAAHRRAFDVVGRLVDRVPVYETAVPDDERALLPWGLAPAGKAA